jgi:perosamine synthetase
MPLSCHMGTSFDSRSNKQTVRDRLRAQGVETADFWGLPHPGVPVVAFPEVDELRRTVVWLPCHQDLSLSTIDRIAEIVHETIKQDV